MKFESKYNSFIEENPFENVIWKMATILSRPQNVMTLTMEDSMELSLTQRTW